MAQTKNKTNYVRNLKGLSTDTKPIYDIRGNGSTFTEIDTGNIYIYNASTKTWVLDKENQKLPEEQTYKGIKEIVKDPNYPTEDHPLTDRYIIKYTNGTEYDFFVNNGEKGDIGEPGKDMDKVVLRYSENGKADGP